MLLIFYYLITNLKSIISTEELINKPYCSFFGNRAPEEQQNLSNCTWYIEKSCCLDTELKITFAKMKPLQGASAECIKNLNYLMCYICSPHQYRFYYEEELKVCIQFCNILYNSCKSAMLKGSLIQELYSNGSEFCESRSFKVNDESSKKSNQDNCFYFDSNIEKMYSKNNFWKAQNTKSQLLHSQFVLITLHFSIIFYKWLDML